VSQHDDVAHHLAISQLYVAHYALRTAESALRVALQKLAPTQDHALARDLITDALQDASSAEDWAAAAVAEVAP